MIPLCFSINSLQSNRPSLVPVSSSVSSVDTFLVILNNLDCISLGIPTPLSFIEISAKL